MWNFVFFDQKADHGCVFICLFVFFFFFFPRDDRIDPVVLECYVARGLILTEMESSSAPFEVTKKLEGT